MNRHCRSYPHCPPEGCWSDRCAVDQPDDGPGSYPPAVPLPPLTREARQAAFERAIPAHVEVDLPPLNKRLHAAPEHDGRLIIFHDVPRCWSCNAVLPHDGVCIDMDCPNCD